MTFPITPPPELVQQWADMLASRSDQAVFTMAAQWGADQELEACCKWLEWWDDFTAACRLRAARRPKPPSLKEQAMAALHGIHDQGPTPEQVVTIRRALEALDD